MIRARRAMESFVMLCAFVGFAAPVRSQTQVCPYPVYIQGTPPAGTPSISIGEYSFNRGQVRAQMSNLAYLCGGACLPGQTFVANEDRIMVCGWPSGGGITSVALSAPSIFTVSGSPITNSGTLALTANAQAAGSFYRGPVSGSPAPPTFGAITLTDLSGALASFNAPTATLAASATIALGPTGNTSTPGLLRLETDGGTIAGRAVDGSDARLALAASSIQPGNPALTDARTPTAHTHPTTDITGGPFVPGRLGNGTASASTFLRGNSTWSAMDSLDIPALGASKITSEVFDPARLGTGTADSTTILYGNGTWGAPPSGGGGSGPYDELPVNSAGASQSSPQIHDTAGNGLLVGKGQAGNAVQLWAGGGPRALFDGNTGRMVTAGSVRIGGDVNSDAWFCGELVPVFCDGSIHALRLGDVLFWARLPAAPFACDADHETATYYNDSSHSLCLCNGSSWGAIGGAGPC